MKRFKYIILSIFSLATLFSCSDTEDIRNDIDDLNARLDKLEATVKQMNEDIAHYQGILNGKLLVFDFQKNEKNGDYILELSDGTRMTVYSGEPAEDLPIMSIGEDGNWYYTMNGETKPLLQNGNLVSANPTNGKTPQLRVNDEGMWEYSYDGNEWHDGIGLAAPGKGGSATVSIFEDVKLSDDKESITFTWKNGDDTLEKTIKLYGGLDLKIDQPTGEQTFNLGSTLKYQITQTGIKDIVIETLDWGIQIGESEMTVTAPKINKKNQVYTDELIIKIFSEEGYCRLITVQVKLTTTNENENTALAWQYFSSKSQDNVLLDFSYAGYMHGEVAPPDVNIDFSNKKTDSNNNPYYEANISGGAQGSVTYKVYNIKDYGAIENDGKSDRHALIKILKDAMKCTEINTENNGKTLRYYLGGSSNANAIIYFPEGQYVLRGGTDVEATETVETLRFTMGNFIFKGAGRDKTTIEMAVKNNAANPEEMWSTPVLLDFKNNSGIVYGSSLADVTGNAEKGTFSVEVSSTSGIEEGDWVCLYLKNNDPALIAEELHPYTLDGAWTELSGNGIQIEDLHQVKKRTGNTIEFYEPIMRKVEAKWGWTIKEYKHYENVGIEDLKLVGHSKEGFKHHGSADDDGAFKPIQMNRLTNSWMRRVDFENVSEAHSFVTCANVSAYDIEISGNRGHSAIRSQGSSRVFIGKVYDHSNGNIATDSGGQNLGEYMEGAGQYHGCGVSKQSMGAVIWNVRWGDDSCFESHATQPRATLIDMCTGGFVPWREGGDKKQLPNHLNDLTIWNMNATRVGYDSGWGNKWIWWDDNNIWWKNLPAIIVGWGGQTVNFDTSTDQLKYYEKLNEIANPLSLYEAQLKLRLGFVPDWLNALK